MMKQAEDYQITHGDTESQEDGDDVEMMLVTTDETAVANTESTKSTEGDK